MSWYLNDARKGEKPNVHCNEDYEFWALRDIKPGEELTVDSRSYSDHPEPKTSNTESPRKQALKDWTELYRF